MVVTRNQTAPEPLALFRALLHGNASMAQRLLAGSGADQLALLAPAGNLTVLHAAVLGRSSAVLPQLTAACAAAGVPVDAALELNDVDWYSGGPSPLGDFLRSMGIAQPSRLQALWPDMAALPLAVRYNDPAAVEALLQAGASVSLQVAQAVSSQPGVGCSQLLGPMLQHGLDPLGPVGQRGRENGCTLLKGCRSQEATDLMLDHLQAQQAAGTLQLGSKHRCLQLLLGACRSDSPRLQLVQFAASRLQQLTGAQAVAASDAAVLNSVLLAAAAAGHSAVLSALLASQLPWDLAAAEPHGHFFGYSRQRGYSLLAVAAMSDQPAASVRVLHQAGAVPTASDLYCAIDQLSPGGVAALLACGVPSIDTSWPEATAPLPAGSRSFTCWSCPIHRTLHALCNELADSPTAEDRAVCGPAVQIVEALLAAGLRPAVYANAWLPGRTRPEGNRELPQLDPFDFYRLETSAGRGLPVAHKYTSGVAIPEWVLFAAQDGSWSPATHRHWPDSCKAAARTLLLAGTRGGSVSGHSSVRRQCGEGSAAAGGGSQQTGCLLGTLPAELLLRIVRAAAEPLSAWL